MHHFSKYTIQHIDLSKPSYCPSLQDGRHYYFVIWRGATPLGHLKLKYNAAAHSPENLSRQLAKAAEKTLKHYQRETAEISDKSILSVPQKTADVSVIICTRNRTPSLRKCLDSLRRLQPEPAEIIVVDNAPDDTSTEDLVNQYPEVMYCTEERPGLDKARNLGMHLASSPIIAYTDDDVTVHPAWIKYIQEAFTDFRVWGMTGLVLAGELATEAQYIFEEYWSFNRGYTSRVYDQQYFSESSSRGVPVWEIGAGANMAFRKDILVQMGGFDERLDVGAAGCSGDSEMWYRILAEGGCIRYEPRAITTHFHRLEMSGLKQQLFYYMRGFAAAILIQYQRYRNTGDLRHLFIVTPNYYLRLLLLNGPRNRFRGRYSTLKQEIKGLYSGVRYYSKHRNTDHGIRKSVPLPAIKTVDGPLVSVIITCYNHANYLPEAIRSVLNQTYREYEVIVVDDGSTDESREVALGFQEVKYVYQSNQGLSAARNTGIQESKGSLLVFLDADDLLYPNALQINVLHFKKHPPCMMVSGSHNKIKSNGANLPLPEENVPKQDHFQALLRGNYVGMHAAVMYRREVFDYYFFDNSLKACEDYDLYLRISRCFPVFSHVEKLAAYRIHEQNMSGDIPFMLKSVLKVLQKNRRNIRTTAEEKALKAGTGNWKRYYGQQLLKKASGSLGKLSAQERTALIRYQPMPFSRLLYRKVRKKTVKQLKKMTPPPIASFLHRNGWYKRYTPLKGKVRTGDFLRPAPFSKRFGYDRGTPVDRYYIENFLKSNSEHIYGRVLEIGDNEYTLAFGKERVSRSDILHVNDNNSNATFIGDLSDAPHLPSNTFDCIVLTQTLQFIYDHEAAMRTCHRILKPGGTLLLTVPGISHIDHGEWGSNWLWSYTGRSVQLLAQNLFPAENVLVQTFGNVFVATCFLYGMCKEEIDKKLLDKHDPFYQVIITLKAVKQ